MRNLMLFFLLLVGAFAHPSFADPVEDAKYISEEHINWERMQREFLVLQTNLLNNLNKGFEPFDAEIADRDLFFDAMFGSYFDDLQSELRTIALAAYLDALTPMELAWTAIYHGLPPEKTLPLNLEELDETKMLERISQMEEFIDDAVASSLSDLADYFDIQRMADMMEKPELVAFQDEGKRRAVVNEIRKMK